MTARDWLVIAATSTVAYVVLRLIRGTDVHEQVTPGSASGHRPARGDHFDEWVLIGGEVIRGVHSSDRCFPPCTIHAPSAHHMAGWPQHWRDDRLLMERICPHGIGHPDPDHWPHVGQDLAHGCDGCCVAPLPGGEQPGIDLRA